MMFRFRLEKVLQQRRREVEARSREVAATRAVHARLLAAHDQAARDLQRHREAAASARTAGALDAAALMRAGAWLDVRQVELVRLGEQVARAAAEVEAAQERLTAAWRDREVLERLRQRQHREWREEQARRERRALDEIGSIRAALAASSRIGGESA